MTEKQAIRYGRVGRWGRRRHAYRPLPVGDPFGCGSVTFCGLGEPIRILALAPADYPLCKECARLEVLIAAEDRT